MRGWWVAGLFAVALAGVLWLRWPQAKPVLAAVTSDLSLRDPGQRLNIARAAASLDGTTLAAGEVFSFNAVVGPRTVDRGYYDATALMEGTRIRSVGGGICQVSSTLYGAAKRAGCQIIRRVPHRGEVTSVPPGEDATVWYGGADLVWRAPRPILVQAKIHDERLIISIVGR